MPGARSNAHEFHGFVFVGDPVAERAVGAVDEAHGRTLSGASGIVRIGIDGNRFSGELGARQLFAGARRFVSLGANVRPGMNQSLPGTAMPPSASDPVFDLLGRIPPR